MGVFALHSRDTGAESPTSLGRRLGRAAVELLFPPRCLACGTFEVTALHGLCVPCSVDLSTARGEFCCPTCAADVAAHEVRLDRCSACRGYSLRVAATVRVAGYRSNLGRLLRAYKYEQRDELAPLLGDWLTEAVQSAPWRDRVEAVVSVPTHWRRRFFRPFHAADALAGLLSRRTQLPHLPLLRRVRAGPHQIGRSLTQRTLNVRGAFALADGVTLRGARLLLIDDVRTTGATIEECARVLRRGGAAEVYAAVICRVTYLAPNSAVLESI